MKKIFLSTIAAGLLVFPMFAAADPITVAYSIGDHNRNGFSASTLHSASGCRGSGPSSGRTLYMCGDYRYDDLTGTVYGTLYDDGILAITGGNLTFSGYNFGITGGELGRFSYGGTTLGTLQVSNLGTFYFEHLQMGSGLPNYFDGDRFILWGQNRRAYCPPSDCRYNRWGIDLYGERMAVSEPETLALFGLGLIALGLRRRKKQALIA